MSAAKFSTAVLIVASLLGLSSCSDIKSPTFQPQLLELRVCEMPASGVCPTDGVQCQALSAANPTEIPVGRSLQFCALARYEVLQEFNDEFTVGDAWRNVTGSVMWASGNDTALEVDQNGVATGRVQTPATEVTASLADEQGQTSVRVTGPALDSIAISPNGPQETLQGTELQFQCLGSFSGACAASGARTCDITSSATFNSSNSQQFAVDDQGLGQALQATSPNTPVLVSCQDVDQSTNETVGPSDPDAEVYVCATNTITSLEIVPSELTIAVGQTEQLSLLANYTSCRTGEPAQLDITDYASWATSDDLVADVNGDGLVSAIDGGTADITGSFGGVTSDPLTVNVKFSEVQSIRVLGPAVVVPGLNFNVAYQAIAVLQDVDTGEVIGEQILFDAPETPNASWSSDSVDLDFADAMVGVAALEPSAQPQDVTITASYSGVEGTLLTQIVDPATAVKSAEIRPTLACVGDALGGLIPLGDPAVAMMSYAIVEYVDDQQQPQTCAINSTQVSEWSTSGAELTSNLLDGLLGGLLSPITDLLEDALLGDCADGGGTLLNFALGAEPFESPVKVGNEVEPENLVDAKGVVSGRAGNALAGGACIYADLFATRASASALAAADIQPVCDLSIGINVLDDTLPSAPLCAPVFEEPPAEEEAAQ